jgi:hypothetical protein
VTSHTFKYGLVLSSDDNTAFATPSRVMRVALMLGTEMVINNIRANKIMVDFLSIFSPLKYSIKLGILKLDLSSVV